MGLFDIFKIKDYKQQIINLQNANANLVKKFNEIGADEYFQMQEKISSLKIELEKQQNIFNEETSENNKIIENLHNEIAILTEKDNKLNKQINTNVNKLSKQKELYKSVEYAINNFFDSPAEYDNCKITRHEFEEYELLCPSITLKLHCLDMKDLRRAYKENENQINKLLEQYSSRYTTKANKSIYSLMVIALRSELQNILYNLKYEKLDSSIELVKNVSSKYLKIAGEGNQSIAGTLTKFIGELEYLFINAVKIEYNYYVKKEQAKQEQLAIREQMRQEAEERKALESERKRIEKEEEKYNSEINKLTEQLSSASDSEIEQLRKRILDLQAQLSDVSIKKEEIAALQNGKAGNVYIISNLGSFGENMFKIGMTRRLNPQERVDELGSASVPFKFDVHSFIFSEDAVALESKLHNILNDKRVNKVNLRKEFFYTTINELEQIVNQIDPTAEFKTTMIAEEYRQSLSCNGIYSSDYHMEFENDESAELLYTKWGTYIMPDQYKVILKRGPREDLQKIN